MFGSFERVWKLTGAVETIFVLVIDLVRYTLSSRICSNAARLHLADEFVPVDRIVQYDVKGLPSVRFTIRHDRQFDSLVRAEHLKIRVRQLLLGCKILVDLLKLRPNKRGLKVGHPIIEAGVDKMHTFSFRIDPMVPQDPEFFSERVIFGNEQTAFS